MKSLLSALPAASSLNAKGMFEGKPIVKVVGVGGAGRRAVESMTCTKWKDEKWENERLEGVEFVCLDTETHLVMRSIADCKLNLADCFLLEGDWHESDDVYVYPERVRLADALRGAHVVFIVAGLGGKAGSLASPRLASIARELGILTIAVVAKPMKAEGRRVATAESGLSELSKRVDAMIVIDNEALPFNEYFGANPDPIWQEEEVGMGDVFEASNWILERRIGSLVEMINGAEQCGFDFGDVRAALHESGTALIGTSSWSMIGEGEYDTCRRGILHGSIDRAICRVENEGCKLSDAHRVLVSVLGYASLSRNEVDAVMRHIREHCARDAQIVVAAKGNGEMGGLDAEGIRFVRSTVIATGF